MDRLATSLLTLFTASSALAAQVVPREDWRRAFQAKGVAGTFVLYEPALDRMQVLDESRARRGFLPASTFKPANAVIGLEAGSIADEKEVFRWDGKPKRFPAWEKDADLGTGMRDSVVWMFQEVARRTGKARMGEWLERLEYGNRSMKGGIDQFWLQGGLRISAFEQVAFLHKLAEGRLPATQRAQKLVREAMVVERGRGWVLHAKTGTVLGGPDAVMWWIGWIERQGRPEMFFAMNLTPVPGTKMGDRHDIAREILGGEGFRTN
jgi:beta-lactamase class D